MLWDSQSTGLVILALDEQADSDNVLPSTFSVPRKRLIHSKASPDLFHFPFPDLLLFPRGTEAGDSVTLRLQSQA